MIADYLLAGQLAARCGLSEQELETYERHGAIQGIAKNRRRYYSARDCIRLQQILRLMRERGLELGEARALVEDRPQLSYLVRRVGEA
jgi:DNA-binding transcriptional MerR regulator